MLHDGQQCPPEVGIPLEASLPQLSGWGNWWDFSVARSRGPLVLCRCGPPMEAMCVRAEAAVVGGDVGVGPACSSVCVF